MQQDSLEKLLCEAYTAELHLNHQIKIRFIFGALLFVILSQL